MTFIEEFEDWLQLSFATHMPCDIKAFTFNFYELAPGYSEKFGVEIIGTKEFDPLDSDWACDEIWAPTLRILTIPVDFSGEHWDQCFERMKIMIHSVLAKNTAVAKILKSKQGIGAGFVDGDLEIIWKQLD